MQEPVSAPMFSINDSVVVTGASKDFGKVGVVRGVYQFGGMYRYVVELSEGLTAVFFGFELVQGAVPPE
jgi:hypothetical protein